MDCFISYSTPDEKFAKYIYAEMQRHGLTSFLAALSLQPGAQWSQEIRKEMVGSTWVIFLASKASSTSAYVQQELGMALAGGKRIVPIVWDMPPAELPGWIKETQALDLRHSTAEGVALRVTEIARTIKASKDTGLLVGAALIGALLLLVGSSKK